MGGVTRDTKEYVQLLLQDTLSVVSSRPGPQVGVMPQGAPSMGSMYPPMYNPMTQYNYMRPPMPPMSHMNGGDSASNGNDPNAQQNRYMEEAMRMQQMYMYYYSMYGGGMNPMMPGFGGGNNTYMNPYSTYGPMASQNKAPNGNAASHLMNPPSEPAPPQHPPVSALNQPNSVDVMQNSLANQMIGSQVNRQNKMQ